jgi:hypothetical protein
MLTTIGLLEKAPMELILMAFRPGWRDICILIYFMDVTMSNQLANKAKVLV